MPMQVEARSGEFISIRFVILNTMYKYLLFYSIYLKVIRRNIRKYLRRPKFIAELGTIDWYYVFLYFCLQKRESRQEVWIGKCLQRPPSDDESVRWGNLLEESRSILDRQNQRIGHNVLPEQFDSNESGASFLRSSEDSSKKRGRFQRIAEKVQTLLLKYNCVPPTELRNVIPANNEDFILDFHNPTNDKYYLSACSLYNLKINSMSLLDLKMLFAEHDKPIFYANNIEPFIYYHDREESTSYLIRLLKYQYNDNTDDIKQLLTNIVSWFNRKGWYQANGTQWVLNPKINCVCINGPPNSGKNYFWDCIAAVALNVGHIGRVSNKCNQFSLQDAYNRRLVMGNELSMEESAKEDFKKLCEGSAFNIRVKFQGDKIFTRTPVCFITNGVLEISGDRHFKDVRLTTIYWLSCSLLKDSTKKPYPLAIFDVFDYFGVKVY